MERSIHCQAHLYLLYFLLVWGLFIQKEFEIEYTGLEFNLMFFDHCYRVLS